MNKDTLKILADAVSMSVSELENALNDENATLNLSGKLYSDSEIEALKKNNQKDAYEAGRKAGVDMLVKDFAKKNGIDGKDFDTVIESFKAKALTDSGKSVEEKDQIIASLRSSILEKEAKISEIESSAKQTILKSRIEAGISSLPLKFTAQETLALLSANGVDAYESDGKIYANLNGQPVRGKLSDPIEFTDYVKDIAEKKSWIKSENSDATKQGRGAAVSSVQKGKVMYKNVSELKSAFERDGKSLNSHEYQVALVEGTRAAKDAGIDFFAAQ